MEKKKQITIGDGCVWFRWSIQHSKTFAVEFTLRFPIKELRPDWDTINLGINTHRFSEEGIDDCAFVGRCECGGTQTGGNALMNTIFGHLRSDAYFSNELIDNIIYAKLAEFKE